MDHKENNSEVTSNIEPSPEGKRIHKNVRRFGPAKIHKELSFARFAHQENDSLSAASTTIVDCWLAALETRRAELGLPESLEDGAWSAAIVDSALT